MKVEIDEALASLNVVKSIIKISPTRDDMLVVTLNDGALIKDMSNIRRAIARLKLPCKLLIKTKDLKMDLMSRDKVIDQLIKDRIKQEQSQEKGYLT